MNTVFGSPGVGSIGGSGCVRELLRAGGGGLGGGAAETLGWYGRG